MRVPFDTPVRAVRAKDQQLPDILGKPDPQLTRAVRRSSVELVDGETVHFTIRLTPKQLEVLKVIGGLCRPRPKSQSSVEEGIDDGLTDAPVPLDRDHFNWFVGGSKIGNDTIRELYGIVGVYTWRQDLESSFSTLKDKHVGFFIPESNRLPVMSALSNGGSFEKTIPVEWLDVLRYIHDRTLEIWSGHTTPPRFWPTEIVHRIGLDRETAVSQMHGLAGLLGEKLVRAERVLAKKDGRIVPINAEQRAREFAEFGKWVDRTHDAEKQGLPRPEYNPTYEYHRTLHQRRSFVWFLPATRMELTKAVLEEAAAF